MAMVPWECEVDMQWCAAGWVVPQNHEQHPSPGRGSIVSQSLPKAAQIGEIGFFPDRPPGAVLHTHRGILEGFGAGMKQGHVVLRARSGNIDFFLSSKMLINGVRIHCAIPPYCNDWPASLVLGKTWVTVTHWTATYRGDNVRATDEIDY